MSDYGRGVSSVKHFETAVGPIAWPECAIQPASAGTKARQASVGSGSSRIGAARCVGSGFSRIGSGRNNLMSLSIFIDGQIAHLFNFLGTTPGRL